MNTETTLNAPLHRTGADAPGPSWMTRPNTNLDALQRSRLGFVVVGSNAALIPDPGGEVVRECLDEIDRLRQVARNVYEVWAGSEGIPQPETSPEAYLLQLIEQMRDEAKSGLKARPAPRNWALIRKFRRT